MKRYKSLDGKVFTALDYEDLAHQLWQSKFIPEETIGQWIRESAHRASVYNGSVLRTTSLEEHIEDMINFGFLFEVVQ